MNKRLALKEEKSKLCKRIIAIDKELEDIQKSKAVEILEDRCAFTDRWCLVVGIRKDLSEAITNNRNGVSQLSFENNLLRGIAKREGAFEIHNPIFLKTANLYDVMETLPKFLAEEGQTYECLTPDFDWDGKKEYKKLIKNGTLVKLTTIFQPKL